MTETRLRPTVGVTIGDPAGIGPEIVVRALAEGAARQTVDVVVIGDRWVLQRAMGATGVGVEFVAEGSPRLIDLANVDHRLQWGKVQATAGAAAGQFIERAVQEALAGRVDALATAPISKEALWRAGYRYPGHTEMLGALTGRPDPLTMFQVRNLRIFFLTRHLSLREAVDQVTRSRIAAILPRIDEALRSIGFERPRVAVAALNPHAGEGGALGLEDQEQIAPAVEEARSRGIDVHGPVPADAVFAQAMEGRYDAVLSLYHDQGRAGGGAMKARPRNWFVKGHGLGNDYLVVEPKDLSFKLTVAAVRAICDRHTGVGSDGILALVPSRRADFGVRIFNPDGSEAEKSGNGLRILSRFLYDHRHTRKRNFTIETRGGVARAALAGRRGGGAGRRVAVAMPGGQLGVTIDADWTVHMTGPAEEVCAGTFSGGLLRRLRRAR